jgi:hypothetical protein
MLKRITTHDIEPTDLDVGLASRLNLLAGDNGLGKTFLLDLAWWAVTGTWAQRAAIPRRREGADPKIQCEVEYVDGSNLIGGTFNFHEQNWDREESRPERVSHVVNGVARARSRFEYEEMKLVIAARSEGGFDVWDSYRTSGPMRLPLGAVAWGVSRRFSLDPRAAWDGLVAEDGTTLCNGLIRDWVTWQFQKPTLFELFTRVLAKLSPHTGEVIKPGPPLRVSIEETRDIPTIVLPYGPVPVTHASAGMRRVLALAYVLVWTWYEHTEAARLRNVAPLREMLLIIDEVDAHLHPTWQRVILPALFEVFPEIERSLRVQVLASTHAPLVLASVETLFDEERDSLLHFALRGGKIVVEKIAWAKQGDAVNWLVSETFGLHQGRSQEAERAIEAAEAFMRGDPTPSDLDTREKIHTELQRVLGGHDDFWPRWLVETGIVK